LKNVLNIPKKMFDVLDMFYDEVSAYFNEFPELSEKGIKNIKEFGFCIEKMKSLDDNDYYEYEVEVNVSSEEIKISVLYCDDVSNDGECNSYYNYEFKFNINNLYYEYYPNESGKSDYVFVQTSIISIQVGNRIFTQGDRLYDKNKEVWVVSNFENNEKVALLSLKSFRTISVDPLDLITKYNTLKH